MLRTSAQGTSPSAARRLATFLVGLFVAGLVVGLAGAGTPAVADDASPTPLTPSSSTTSPSAKSPSGGSADQQRATFGIGPASLSAQNRQGFYSYAMGVGGSYHDKVMVVNFGATPLTLAVYAADLDNGADGQVVVGLPKDTAADAGGWVQLPGKQLSVTVPPASATKGPGRTLIPFRVVVPYNAPPGDHAAAIVAVLSTLGRNPKGQNVRLDQRIATRMYIRVSGPLTPALTIENLKADYHGTLNPLGKGTATVSYTVRNSGNVRLAGTQLVRVTGLFGTKSEVVTGPRIELLLPGSSERVTVEVPGVFPTFLQKAKVTVTPLLFSDQRPTPLTEAARSVTFRAVPGSLIGMVVLLLLVALVVVLLVRRRRRRPPSRHTRARRPRGSGPTEPSPAPVPTREPEQV